jgi:hypothetical protein
VANDFSDSFLIRKVFNLPAETTDEGGLDSQARLWCRSEGTLILVERQECNLRMMKVLVTLEFPQRSPRDAFDDRPSDL